MTHPQAAMPAPSTAAPDWGDASFIMAAAAPLAAAFSSLESLPSPTGLPSSPLPAMPALPGAAPPSSSHGSVPATANPVQAVPLDTAIGRECLMPLDDPALESALAGLRGPTPGGAGPDLAPGSTALLQQTPDIDAALAALFGAGKAFDFPTFPAAKNTPAPGAPPAAAGNLVYPASPAGMPAAGHGSGEELTALEVKSIRSDFPILHQKVNGYPLAWLDNAATTQKPQAVMDALNQFYARDNSNIHRAAHALAARATDAYEAARGKVQQFLKAKSASEIVFLRGTTEAINLVAQSYGRANLKPGDEVLVTTMEHHANIVPWQMVCQEKGALLRAIPISDAGDVDLAAYAQMLSPRTRFVALTHVSNVLGTLVPVREMTAMAHAVGARVLVDGAQAVAHLPIDVCEIGCDFYVFSGHKIFGPTGVGALYGRYELLEAMPPWQGGGNMIDEVTFAHTSYAKPPAKFEAGTATLGDAVGLGVALDYVNRIGLARAAKYEQSLLRAATAGLSQIQGLHIYGNSAHKAAVVSFLIDGIPAEEVGKQLDGVGIAVRTGHHCAQPTMQRYGVRNMVRPSFAMYNTFEEVDRLVQAVQRIRYGKR